MSLTRIELRSRRTGRLRHRLLPILTLHVAALWAWAAWVEAANLGSANLARGLMMFMTPPVKTAPSYQYSARRPQNPLLNILPPAGSVTPEQQKLQEQLAHQMAATEGIVLYWKRAMFGLAIAFDLLVLLGALTGWTRGCHLMIALLMLLGAVATIVGIWLLVNPNWGGMPPLPWKVPAAVYLEWLRLDGLVPSMASITLPGLYVMVPAVQTTYALILLVAFGRRPPPPPPVPQPAEALFRE